MKTFFCSVLLFISINAISQTPVISDVASGTSGSIQFLNMTSTYDVLSGSPYVNPNFEDGLVMQGSSMGKWQKGYKLRFNTYSKLLEFQDNGKILTAYPKQVRGFKIGNSIYMAGFLPVDNQTPDSYYQILYDGKVKLLKYSYTILETVRAADDTKQGDKFTTNEYMYLLENDKMTKFLPFKKNLLKLIPSDKLPKVEAFIVEKNLKFKAESDYVEVIKYYDGL